MIAAHGFVFANLRLGYVPLMFFVYLVKNLINFLFFGQNRYLELCDWNTQQAIHDALEDVEWEQVQETVQCTVTIVFMNGQFSVKVVENVHGDEYDIAGDKNSK
jgi:hypothetical protein